MKFSFKIKAKHLVLTAIFILSLLGAFNFYFNHYNLQQVHGADFSDFLKDVESGRVKEVFIRGDTIVGRYQDDRLFTTHKPGYEPRLTERLMAQNVRIKAAPPEESGMSFIQLFLSWLPMLLLLGVWIVFLRQMNQGTGKAIGFGRSRAKIVEEGKIKVTFDDVAGIPEAKEDVKEIVDFLKEPEKFKDLGARIPKGVLLVGPPGTGKTLLAKAIAGEADVPFLFVSGSDFVEMFVGVGASRVRDLFEQAREKAPCIIFIDEIDGLGSKRVVGAFSGGNDEREQTLNQLLVEMDGFQDAQGIIIIAATNRPDIIDPALLRPGRFDRQVMVPLPDLKGRQEILERHMRNVVIDADVSAEVIAKRTPGFSGADLANVVNEAAILAGRHNRKSVRLEDFEQALDKIIMGHERRSLVMTEEEKRLTAYHEAGHAVVTVHSPESDPIHKATILPRGRSLGLVMRLPERDRISMSRAKLMADMAVGCGGRVAEELIFGEEKVTTGASSDIQMITDVARRMVTEWGMSHRVGPLYYAQKRDTFVASEPVADATALQIDEEVRELVSVSYQRAKTILTTYMHHLHVVANALLEKETLTGQEIKDLLFPGEQPVVAPAPAPSVS